MTDQYLIYEPAEPDTQTSLWDAEEARFNY